MLGHKEVNTNNPSMPKVLVITYPDADPTRLSDYCNTNIKYYERLGPQVFPLIRQELIFSNQRLVQYLG